MSPRPFTVSLATQPPAVVSAGRVREERAANDGRGSVVDRRHVPCGYVTANVQIICVLCMRVLYFSLQNVLSVNSRPETVHRQEYRLDLL